MQFIVTGYDGSDEKALERRMAVREDHMKLVESMKGQGRHLYAAALLDESEKMIGSVLIVDFPTREDLDNWLKIEPYIVGNVWKTVEVKSCKVPPMFLNQNK